MVQNMSMALHWAKLLPQFHPGSDMFVWRSTYMESVINNTKDVFFGYAPLGEVLEKAIDKSVKKFQLVQGKRWTFHVGREREHRSSEELKDRIPHVEKMCTKIIKDYPQCQFDVE